MESIILFISDLVLFFVAFGVIVLSLWFVWHIIFALFDRVNDWFMNRDRDLIGQAIFDHEVGSGSRKGAALHMVVQVMQPESLTVRQKTTVWFSGKDEG